MPAIDTRSLQYVPETAYFPPGGPRSSGASPRAIPPEPTEGLAVNPVLKAAPWPRAAAFVGPLGIGKDHAATTLGFNNIVKMAGALYEIVERMWGQRVDKALPGWRETLCKVGAWGRGEVTSEYPVTPERLMFVAGARARAGYEDFGRANTFWLDRAFAGAQGVLAASKQVGITDIRYPNELDRALELRFEVYFVACRPWVLDARRQRLGYALHNVGDQSERMANEWYQRVTIARLPLQTGVRVLWSDTPESCPDFALPLFVR